MILCNEEALSPLLCNGEKGGTAHPLSDSRATASHVQGVRRPQGGQHAAHLQRRM